MTDAQTPNDLEERQRILDNIEKFGCHLILIEPDNYLPGFVYSIGLFKKFGHPEIICFGLKTNVMASLINDACALIKQGKTFRSNFEYSDFLEDLNIRFLDVDKEYYSNYLGYARWFYTKNSDFPTLQLIWPDKQSNYPWDKDFNTNWKFKQPLLDRNTDFKFYEERTLGVFTTQQVLDGEPILFVYHNDDGDWQFHAIEDPNLDEAKVVCLEEITKLDPTINEIYHLQFGWHAWRNKLNDEWQYAEDTAEK